MAHIFKKKSRVGLQAELDPGEQILGRKKNTQLLQMSVQKLEYKGEGILVN